MSLSTDPDNPHSTAGADMPEDPEISCAEKPFSLLHFGHLILSVHDFLI